MSAKYTPGTLVKKIQSYNSEEEVVSKFCRDGTTILGFSELWVRNVFRNRVTLPILDLTVDVHGEGEDVLDAMGVSDDTQSVMWQRWITIPEDVKASWLEGWNLLDREDNEDVFSYVRLMVDFLTS